MVGLHSCNVESHWMKLFIAKVSESVTTICEILSCIPGAVNSCGAMWDQWRGSSCRHGTLAPASRAASHATRGLATTRRRHAEVVAQDDGRIDDLNGHGLHGLRGLLRERRDDGRRVEKVSILYISIKLDCFIVNLFILFSLEKLSSFLVVLKYKWLVKLFEKVGSETYLFAVRRRINGWFDGHPCPHTSSSK